MKQDEKPNQPLQPCSEGMDLPKEAETLFCKAQEERQNRHWQKSASLLKQALEVCEKTADVRQKILLTANLATVYWQQAQLKKALKLFQQAHETLQALKNPEEKNTVQSLLAVTYWRIGEQDQAINLIRGLLPIKLPAKSSPYYPLIDAIKDAADKLENRIPLAQGSRNLPRQIMAHTALVPIYLCLGLNDCAKNHLDSARKISQPLNPSETHETLIKLEPLVKE